MAVASFLPFVPLLCSRESFNFIFNALLSLHGNICIQTRSRGGIKRERREKKSSDEETTKTNSSSNNMHFNGEENRINLDKCTRVESRGWLDVCM
jgi:hypothetical protein